MDHSIGYWQGAMQVRAYVNGVRYGFRRMLSLRNKLLHTRFLCGFL